MRKKVGEFQLISRIARLLPQEGEGVVLAVGDDAALVSPPRGEELALTVDEVFEGVHFGPGFSPEDIGWKALAVNLSDLASMGARPLWALFALAFPKETGVARVLGVARGVAACARRYGVSVVGGNVSRAPALSVSITALGAVRTKMAIRRDGARPGDLILASGTFGDAALGLEKGASQALLKRQRRPTPRLALGRAVAGLVNAGIDVSDGLVQDISHVAEASSLQAVVESVRIPTSPAYRARAASLADPLGPALSGGEDYELVLAVPKGRLGEVMRVSRRVGTRLAVVGHLRRGKGVLVIGENGKPREAPSGHDHLRAQEPQF